MQEAGQGAETPTGQEPSVAHRSAAPWSRADLAHPSLVPCSGRWPAGWLSKNITSSEEHCMGTRLPLLPLMPHKCQFWGPRSPPSCVTS